jgi:flagellar basal body P-ring formation protein FlgA
LTAHSQKPLLRALRWAAAVCMSASATLWAQTPGDPSPDLLLNTRQWLDSALKSSRPDLANQAHPVRTEVVVGALDSRMRLAACGKVEPFIPPGSRLWGKTRVGLRCVDGPVRWTVYLPLTVKVFGRAWVINGNLPAGTALSVNDASQSEVDWAEDASPVVADMSWIGQTLTRPVVSGQVVRSALLRAPFVFQAGASVRVVAQGPGFSVSSDGQAMASGVVGQPARVKVEGGRVMTGIVIDDKTVRVDM